ncbi:MAG: hypothetical protein H0X45_10850, partial [Planctomycetes bacterium]|nr:hypothetical protein [Planctomycetota bacterium]
MTDHGSTLALTPHGRLALVPAADAPALPTAIAAWLQAALVHGAGHALLALGGREVGT